MQRYIRKPKKKKKKRKYDISNRRRYTDVENSGYTYAFVHTNPEDRRRQ
jgi:hypothetical protein